MVQRPKNLEKNHVLNLKGIFVNGTMKLAGSRAVAARTMAGMIEEVTDCGSSCRMHFSPHEPLRGRGYLPIFSRILLEKVGGTYLSLCNKNSDLIFLENFTRKGGRGYLPIFSRILLEKVGYLPISNLFELCLYTYRSKKSNAGLRSAFQDKYLGR